MKTIELSSFKKTKSTWGGSEPFAMAFVYSPKGNVVVKGMSPDVTSYVQEHYPQCVYNMTWFSKEGTRSMWTSPPTCPVFFRKIRCGNRIKTQIMVGVGNHVETVSIVRRVPKRWLPAYDKAISKSRL